MCLAVEERLLMGSKGFKKHWAYKENSEHIHLIYSFILKTISNKKLRRNLTQFFSVGNSGTI